VTSPRALPRIRVPWVVAASLVAALAGSHPLRAGQAAERWHATVSPSGQVLLSLGRRRVAVLAPGLADEGWRFVGVGHARPGPDEGKVARGVIRAPNGTEVDSELRSAIVAKGLRLAYKLTPRKAVTLNSLHVAADLPIALVAGREFVADDTRGTIPAQFTDQIHLSSGPARAVELSVRGGAGFRLDFESPTPVLLQDNRKWGPSFTVRIGPQTPDGREWKSGESLEMAFTLTAEGGIDVEYDTPVTIAAGEEWVPLKVELDIVPGSALDFSQMGHLDPPAGKHGRLIARPDGQLAFEKDPDTPRRFYGVNLCFSAHYIDHALADRLADRLARLGYNAVRYHHYEGELIDRSKGDSVTLNPEKLDQLDYLQAALRKRGIYTTTDLFVSRPVFAREIWDGATGDVGMDNFKMLVPVNERAFENWKAFARNLLSHVNPHTSLSYAKDPALAWLSMINEGNFGNFLGRLNERIERDWAAAWNRFLAARYDSRDALGKAWGTDPGGDPKAGTVPLFKSAYDNSPRGRDLVAFLAETERDMFARMRRFLRDELGCAALLTDNNSWTNPAALQAARAEFDYVDDHFYVDHPQFIEQPWRLPSRCNNANPIAEGAPGGRHCAFVRLFGKPFTVSEFNYSGPGRFRGVGGILTGCMGALQDWSVIWRFTYSHHRGNLGSPAPAGYFDLATDPLNQAADRAAVCLYLRRDMRPAPHAVAITMNGKELVEAPTRNTGIAPSWHELALITRVGTFLADPSREAPADFALPQAPSGEGEKEQPDPYAADTGGKVVETMRARGWLRDNLTDLSKNILHSETGELLVDAPREIMVLNTPRTAGGYAREGVPVEAGPVTVEINKTDATVWVSSVDGKPIAESRRLILSHLTDLQNTGARFGEKARQTLLAWGELPHVVRAGSATVTVKFKEAKAAKAWALATSGRRVAEVPAELRDGTLTIPISVAGPEGARMIYEIEVQ